MMTGFNLLPWREELFSIRRKRFFGQILIVMTVTSLTFFLCRYEVTQKTNHLKGNIMLWQQQKSSVLLQLKKLEAIKKEMTVFQKQNEYVHQLQRKRMKTFKLFEVLANAVPHESYLVSLQYYNNHIFIMGEAKTAQIIYEFINNLNHTGFFTEVLVKEITDISDKNRFNKKFQIKLVLP